MVTQPGVYTKCPVLAAPVVALGAVGWMPPDLGVVDGDEIPYQPWAAKRKRENFANWLDRDPEIQCFLPGVPRAMYMPYKFQIIQGTNKILMVFEFAGAQRTIHLDEVDPYPADAYMGHSVAKWEGDTLVVDVSRFTAQTWFDRAGNFHSDALHVVERIRRSAVMRSGTKRRSKIRRCSPARGRSACRSTVVWTDAQMMEFRCQEMAEETALGHLRKQPLVRRWDGNTMRIDVTRKVPRGDAVAVTWTAIPRNDGQAITAERAELAENDWSDLRVRSVPRNTKPRNWGRTRRCPTESGRNSRSWDRL